MINVKIWGYVTLLTLISLEMGGCSSSKVKNTSDKTRMLGTPSAKIETDPAILGLEAAVRKSPNDPETWNKLTKAYFENKQYDKAIQTGNTSLQLKPDNPDIRNTVFVSGLRIASSSLEGIRKDKSLTGSNLNDAETLVSGIRQSLGETSLTDTAPAQEATPKQPTVKTHRMLKPKPEVHVFVPKVKHIKASYKPEVKPDIVQKPTPTVISNPVVTTVSKPVVATVSKPVVVTVNKPVVATKPAPANGSNPFSAFK